MCALPHVAVARRPPGGCAVDTEQATVFMFGLGDLPPVLYFAQPTPLTRQAPPFFLVSFPLLFVGDEVCRRLSPPGASFLLAQHWS